jgi:hypothetical protein
VFAEELVVLDGEGELWQQARPLLEAALRLEQNADTSVWHGWQKGQVRAFLQTLPSPSSLVVGVWDTLPASSTREAQDTLVLGIICEVVAGTVRSICTFDSLVAAGLKPVDELQIGMEDALEIMHYTRRRIAPVAWALFIERSAWDEWLFAAPKIGGALDKGELLGNLAQKGRCVLMGNSAARYETE